MNLRGLGVKIGHQSMILRGTPFLNVSQKCHMTNVNIFVEVSVKLPPPADSCGIIIEGRMNL